MKKILFLLLLVSCGQSTPFNYMGSNNVKYIDKFSNIFFLENETKIDLEKDLDIIGIKNFVICDSLIIFSTKLTDGIWSFFSLPHYNKLGDFLSQGDAPYEFIQSPSVASETKFYHEKDTLFAYIHDFQKGYLYRMNIDKSIQNQKLQISKLNTFLPPFLFNLSIMDSTKFFCKEVNDNITGQIRYLYEDNNKNTSNYLDKLNRTAIKEGEDINILSTSIKFSSKNNIIVEMPIGLNYINMYSLDDSFEKTICIGNELDDINKIQNTSRWDRIYTYADLRIFDNFWGVVHINEDEKTYQVKRNRLPSILLFDWSGEPLFELKSNRFFTSFDIDFFNGFLYTYDIPTEEFYRYDIHDLLKSLP